jgi:hypothetical protein
VIFYDPYDPDPMVSERWGGCSPERGRRRGLGALDLDGEGVPVIAELREDDDDAQLEVAKMLAK